MTDGHPAARPPEQSPEQLRYAAWIERGTMIGLVVLVASFAVYVLGLLPSAVAPQDLGQLWGLPVREYLQRSGAPTGWAWWRQLGQGDVLALSGIVVLAGCSVPALLALVPGAWRRDRVLALLCLAEVAVIVLAATGWLGKAH